MKGQDEFKNDLLEALSNIINTYHLEEREQELKKMLKHL